MADKIASKLYYAAIFSPNYKKELDFRGYIQSLSSNNSEGAFDVLPLHENFVTILYGDLVIVDDAGQSRSFQVDRAVLEASNNIVKVFVEF